MTMDDLNAGDRQLANDLGWPLQRLCEVVGTGWEPVAPADNDGYVDLDQPQWYVAGEPAQVMLGVSREPAGQVLVARPSGVWRSWMLTYEPQLPTSIYLGDVAALQSRLAEVATSRRRSFRWCRYCRTPAAPEHRTEVDVCSGCATDVQGVVF